MSNIWWFRSIREKNSFRKCCNVRKKINMFALISKCKSSLLAQSLHQQLVLVLWFYRVIETVLKQSECVFALGYFLNLESNLKIHLHLWYELRKNRGKWYLILYLKAWVYFKWQNVTIQRYQFQWIFINVNKWYVPLL